MAWARPSHLSTRFPLFAVDPLPPFCSLGPGRGTLEDGRWRPRMATWGPQASPAWADSSDLVWRMGGEQGEGVDSSGDLLSTVATRAGYHVYGYRLFSSRIKGGHTTYTVRISTRPRRASAPWVHVLVALDQATIDLEHGQLVEGGLVLADSHFGPQLPPDRPDLRLVSVPLTHLARQAGSLLARNMVALGASSYLLGLSLETFQAYVRRRFESKGEEVVAQNLAALAQGHASAREALGGPSPLSLPPSFDQGGVVLTGNEAIALGAVAAGCRFFAGYPITPASSILETLVRFLPRYGGVVVQAEDEMAAISMALGASYGGVRAMTATSGPGLSLMQEGLGLASATELPLVVVDCQRAGPSTGMPTKTEQSDLLSLLYGGHGEAPRMVLVPATVEDAFWDTVEAFNLADRLQCPVLLASDLALSEWKCTADPAHLDPRRVTVDRGPVVQVEDLASVPPGHFPRYDFTPSGVSPRSLPGMPHGEYLATGNEHNRFGKVTEDPAQRTRMVDKRWDKLKGVDFPGVRVEGSPDAPWAIVALGSTYGAVQEAREHLQAAGVALRHVHVRRLGPFPTKEVRQALKGVERALVVEHNRTG
jgi:2-oxoglutarate ferredoxin oxidoreductase subunit alpha